MPDQKQIPSVLGLLLSRAWFLGFILLAALTLWRIYQVPIAVTIGFGISLYGAILTVIVLLQQAPHGVNWYKYYLLRIPILMVSLGFAEALYGLSKETIAVLTFAAAGVVTWLLLSIVFHVMASKYAEDK
jgi:hypothetical protein